MDLPEKILSDIANGNAILVTGAGISLSGKNRFDQPIASSTDFAKKLCTAANFEYSHEPLSTVYQAVKDNIKDIELKRLFRDNFCECQPSEALLKALKFTWKRFYTFNVDDTIKNVPKYKRIQRYNFFNGLSDRREEWRSFEELSVVSLHGMADQIENGLIFSHEEYAHYSAYEQPWYSRLGEDFSEYTIIFVGTSLDEPIFRQLSAKFKPKSGFGSPSYIVSPGSKSMIESKSLSAEGIEHIMMDADQFFDSLISSFPDGINPKEIYKDKSEANNYSALELESLKCFSEWNHLKLASKYKEYSGSKHKEIFFQGFGPTWPTILKNEYAKLHFYDSIYNNVKENLGDAGHIAVVGEAGSGKSTFIYWLTLELTRSTNFRFFFYEPGTTKFIDDFRSFRKYIGDEKSIVYIEEATFYNSELVDILSDARYRNITVILESRKSEWIEKNEVKIGKFCSLYEVPRYAENDIGSLVDCIDQNYAAPYFSQLNYEEKFSRFRKSRKQLLIALREVTKGIGFSDIIEDEIQNIKSEASRFILNLVSVATIARTGISLASAKTMFGKNFPISSFESASNSLEGIVEQSPKNGRLYARHELYARDVINKHISIEDYEKVIYSFVEYFSQFDMPIVKNITQIDSKLFRFIINSKTLYDQFERFGKAARALGIYERFDIKLQQDGHFWMQYGLLLRRLRRQKEALDRLEKSIQAYPDNPYAVHALAQQKLIYYTFRESPSSLDWEVIQAAADTLVQQHTDSMSANSLYFDEYPLVTVGYLHVNLLYRHKQIDQATKAAQIYFDMAKPLRHIEKIRSMMSDLAKLVKFGVWGNYTLERGDTTLHVQKGEKSKNRRFGR